MAADPEAAKATRVSRRDFLAADVSAAPPEADYWLRVHRRAMACRFEVTLGGEDADRVADAREALDEVDAIEAQLTVFRESSALVHVNRRAADGPVPVSQDLFELLTLCRTLHDDTGGAFDVTSTPLSRCWGFLKRDGRLPRAAEIASARACVGMHRVVLEGSGRTVRFAGAGTEVNLGAIGKGWALDAVACGLRRRGVACALLSAGRSSVLAVGSRGRGWPIDLTSPRLDGRIARVYLRGGALGTSGAGEQFFEIEGRRYGHVLDPRTGWPAASGVLSASVLASRAAVADALSTAFLVAGVHRAREYCAAHGGVMAVMSLDDRSGRPQVIGSADGAEVEIG